ncbi:MAG TPA: ATP-binding protein [Acidimicrobiales bacterium]|nr:ATP-binding protein [Acidimicrobiales bacterium]
MKLGIGARITAVFGLGALILSILMGGLSYFTVRHFLLAGRESAAQHQAFNNAVLVRSSLEQGTKPQKYVPLLASIDSGSDAHSVLYHRSKAYESSLSVSASIPVQLRKDVLSGTAATQTYRTSDGTAEIGVGLPIPSVHAFYFEVFDLSDLDHTLRVLGLTLFVAGVVTTLLGTGLGRFASVRSLRPLADVSRAAGAIAEGDLDTRLDTDAADPDLEGLTNSFNAMVDQLQERIEREARFNSDVSHELRSPLTTLAAALEVLEADRDDLPVRSQAALQLLSDDLRRFQRMVGDLLEMSRADAGSVDIFLEEVNVSELVQRSVETGFGHMVSLHSGGPPDVQIDPAVRTWRAGVDKRRFERVMVNLMENADHYGGGATAITVGPGDDGLVEVTVDDDGPGIDPRERLKIFERFYRGSASGKRGTGTGTGLGLALVAEHMHVMHGDVRVESSASGGARFILTLPVLDDGDEDGDGE